jgi:hypothetical protein
VCELSFSLFKCVPESFPDKPFVRANELPKTVSIAGNDRVYDMPHLFVWSKESIDKSQSPFRLFEDGSLRVDATATLGIHRFRYRMCLKSGTWCSSLSTVEVFVLPGKEEKVSAKSEQTEELGLMRRSGSTHLLPRQHPLPSPVECNATENAIGNLGCVVDEGCPYGYNDNWECETQPPADLTCADAEWKAELAKLWTRYFRGGTNINAVFDGMLAQPPCTNCNPATRV